MVILIAFLIVLFDSGVFYLLGRLHGVQAEKKRRSRMSKDILESLDNSLDRDRRTHSGDYREGWDDAFQKIYDWIERK